MGSDELGQFLAWATGRARYLTTNARHFERVFLRFWLFTLATGCRPGEAVAMRWDQIDRKRRLVVLTEHKTAESAGSKIIPLSPRALRILRRLQSDPRRHPVCVFPHRPAKGRGKARTDLERRCGQPWSSTQSAGLALRRLRRLAIEAGCELTSEGPGRLIAYSGRYRSVTDKLRSGMSAELVARLHGHSPEMVRDVYEQIQEEDLVRLLEEIEGGRSGVGQPSIGRDR